MARILVGSLIVVLAWLVSMDAQAFGRRPRSNEVPRSPASAPVANQPLDQAPGKAAPTAVPEPATALLLGAGAAAAGLYSWRKHRRTRGRKEGKAKGS